MAVQMMMQEECFYHDLEGRDERALASDMQTEDIGDEQ